jgi:uncharacterized sulfatase
MQTKTDLVDFVTGNYQLSTDNVFTFQQNLSSSSLADEDTYNQLKSGFEKFKAKNNQIINGGKIIPDSIYNAYSPK